MRPGSNENDRSPGKAVGVGAQWWLGLSATVLATVAATILRERDAVMFEHRIGYLYQGLVLVAAAPGILWHSSRRRLASGIAVVAAGLTLGTAVMTMSSGAGLLFVPGGVLLTLGAHQLWEKQKAPPPAPPRSGEGSAPRA